MAAQPQPHFTVAEYLAQENESTFKHEYFQGRVYAMSGASPAHSVISTNLAALFVAQLRGSSCTTFSNDTRITVPANGLYTYPDLSIVCGKPIFDEQDPYALVNPTVIIEILSNSTEAYDRGSKFQLYRGLPSLQEYVLIAQNQPRIERFLRPDWALTDCAGLDSSLTLVSLPCTLKLAEVYERITFTTPPELR